MSDTSTNKRVAKNTLILYVRMFITMAIGIWTSRLVINALGFTDQGLYNVVGGFVGLSALVTGSISVSISRFITYEIGKGDYTTVTKVVQNAFSVQWTLAAIVILLAETVGLWFLNTRLVIPADRLFAVNIVYQLSVGTIVISLLTSAPNALIIAHERMNIYAYVAVANSALAFLIALCISYYGGDRLILYSALQFLVSAGTIVFYTLYCRYKFKFIKYRFAYDKEIFAPIFSFAGWNGIGSSAAILRSSGTSILLNMFGGPIANTINGIAGSVNNLATLFVKDFTTAYTPQITKKYAAEDYSSLIQFLHQCSKFSYCLLAVMAIPLMFNIHPLLVLWLKKIPDGTVIFAQLIIVYSMIECLCRPLIVAKDATGKIRNYQIVVGGILLLTIPLTYVFFKLGLPIYFAYVSILITSVAAFMARMLMLNGSIPGWSSCIYLKKTVLRCIMATAICLVVPGIMHLFLPESAMSSIAQCIVGFFWCCACVYYIACDKNEKDAARNMINTLKHKVLRKNA